MTEVLRDALRGGRTGELVVSAEGDAARVHVDRGRVAWVHRPQHPVSLRHLLAAGGIALADETALDVADECRRTRRHFGEVLIARGIADRETIAEALRVHVEREMEVVSRWADATATFVVDERSSGASFLFTPGEVLPASWARSGTADGLQPAAATGDAERWLDRVASLPEVTGCALLDAAARDVLGSRGTGELEVVADLAAAFVALGVDAEELVATTRGAAYLVRPVGTTFHAIAVVCFDPSRASPALARILVGKATSS